MEPEEDAPAKKPFFSLSGCLVLTVALVAIATMVTVNMRSRGPRMETGTIGYLKTISMAQTLFREGDKENDGNLDYGTLAELSTAGASGGLIDAVLGSGTKQGYLFECSYGATTSEFLWFATARPTLPGTTGYRYYVTNHEGVIFYTTSEPFLLNTVDCTIPAGATRFGR
jgi:hypothetical protein